MCHRVIGSSDPFDTQEIMLQAAQVRVGTCLSLIEQSSPGYLVRASEREYFVNVDVPVSGLSGKTCSLRSFAI